MRLNRLFGTTAPCRHRTFKVRSARIAADQVRTGSAGTPIAQDGDKVWHAPYDDTVLVMPSVANLRPGNTQARLGRFEPG